MGTIFVSKDQNAISGYSHVFKDVLTKFEKFGKLEHIDHDFKSMLFESFLKESISKKNWGRYLHLVMQYLHPHKWVQNCSLL